MFPSISFSDICQYKDAKVPLTENQEINRSVAVSVHSGCYNKNTINWVTYKKHFPQFWRLESPRLWCQQMWYLVRSCFALTSQSGRGMKLSSAFFVRALIPFIRALPLRPNHLLMPSHWGLGFRHKSWGTHTFRP